MTTTMLLGIVAIAALLAISVLWRISSRRHALPCPSWLAWMVELDNPLAKTNRASYIVSRLNLSGGMKVLDAGCGPGRVTIPLAKAVGPDGSVVAVDLQPKMLELVASKARDAGVRNVTTLLASLGQAKLEAGSYDRAVMAAVLGEIPDRHAALVELFRCLKPGGQLAVAELIFDPHFQRRSTINKLACGVGFEERAFFGNGIAYMLLLERPQ